MFVIGCGNLTAAFRECLGDRGVIGGQIGKLVEYIPLPYNCVHKIGVAWKQIVK